VDRELGRDQPGEGPVPGRRAGARRQHQGR
jgi:hypothetical protein